MFTCSGFSRGFADRFRRVTRSGWISTMWAPPSMRAWAFTETRSVGLHVQMKCFPFKGGALLTDAMLQSESSAVLVSALTWAFCGNTVAINSVGFGACAISTVAGMGGGGAGQEFPRAAFTLSVSCKVRVLYPFPVRVTMHALARCPM